MTDDPALVPAIGDTVRDTHHNRLGIVTDRLGPRLRLRPLTGGRAWEANPEDTEPLSAPEALRARLAEVNARSRKPRQNG
ncbi:hypothetical protein [Streptomyces antarcticus]|uniref:hypothetical protein n=1 Tax=Streptomyces antarcticus TaxID=2996458 RepID=UPI00226FB125|nr:MULTISPECIES: hypothetical protein [unclassified Streptomyces]MCY0946180.1 hypothetical protein [Streptomyces sp. H34-AA3]MCZ4084968.1 hypothetical protein [Streptomyces sp. H34-S5]